MSPIVGRIRDVGGSMQAGPATVNDPKTAFPGEDVVQSAAHVCALYSGPKERDRLLVRLMRRRLRNGDHCVRLVDDVEASSMPPPTYGCPGPGHAVRAGQAGLHPTSDVALGAGEFSVEQLAALLASSVASSTDDERPPLRAAADLSWVIDEPGPTGLGGYESAVNQVLADRPTLLLCMYDLHRLGVSMLVDVLRTHSEVLLEGAMISNPRCMTPTGDAEPGLDAVTRYPLARRPGAREDGVDQWLSLTGAEIRVAELVSSGMSNRAVAAELTVSRHTVDAHLKHIYVKLGIHSRVELTVLALEHGPRVR